MGSIWNTHRTSTNATGGTGVEWKSKPNEDIDATVLRFDGLATLAEVWLNDRLVLERTCARGADVLLVFSEGDPGLDFVQRRHAREVRLLERRRSNFAMRIVRGADHTLTRLEARARLMHLLTTHLVARHRG